MSLFRKIQRIKTQIVDTEKMLQMVQGHPIMSVSFKEKLRHLRDQLDQFPKDVFEPKVNLLFSGDAVKGSVGINSIFLSNIIKPFQELIKTQAALLRFGELRKGNAKRDANTELYLTALPTGSFGVELSQLEANDLFAELDAAKAIKQTIELIYFSAESDEQFERVTENSPKKTLENLEKFLQKIAEKHSILKMESGNLEYQISEEGIQGALERVASTTDEEEELFITGTLRGVLLNSGRFEVVDSEGKPISGYIGEDLEEDEVIAYDQQFLNRQCQIHLRKHKVIFRTGKEKTSYELLEIAAL